MPGGAKADVKYGFFVGLGILIAVAIWGLATMLMHGGMEAVKGG